MIATTPADVSAPRLTPAEWAAAELHRRALVLSPAETLAQLDAPSNRLGGRTPRQVVGGVDPEDGLYEVGDAVAAERFALGHAAHSAAPASSTTSEAVASPGALDDPAAGRRATAMVAAPDVPSLLERLAPWVRPNLDDERAALWRRVRGVLEDTVAGCTDGEIRALARAGDLDALVVLAGFAVRDETGAARGADAAGAPVAGDDEGEAPT